MSTHTAMTSLQQILTSTTSASNGLILCCSFCDSQLFLFFPGQSSTNDIRLTLTSTLTLTTALQQMLIPSTSASNCLILNYCFFDSQLFIYFQLKVRYITLNQLLCQH
jgi:hypothetical protein